MQTCMAACKSSFQGGVYHLLSLVYDIIVASMSVLIQQAQQECDDTYCPLATHINPKLASIQQILQHSADKTRFDR